MFGKRLAFWGAVAGVSVLAQFGMEFASDRLPSGALKDFVGYIHRGGKD